MELYHSPTPDDNTQLIREVIFLRTLSDAPTATPTATAIATATPTPTATATDIAAFTPTPTATGCAAAPTAPALLAPADKAKVRNKRVRLEWSAVECAQHYNIIVRVDSDKGKQVDKATLAALQYTTKPLAPGKTYFWRVAACNASQCAASAWRSFRIK